jgi:hypothetical protein
MLAIYDDWLRARTKFVNFMRLSLRAKLDLLALRSQQNFPAHCQLPTDNDW